MPTKVIDPFTNIAVESLPVASKNDSMFLSDIREMNVGDGGSLTFRADQQGIWLGAEKFEDAVFSVTMAGVAKWGLGLSSKVFTAQPTTPYHVGDLWAGGASGEFKRCITERLTGAYNAADWESASKYTDTTGITTIVGGIVTTDYLNAKGITAYDFSATIVTGKTIQTAATGKRIKISSSPTNKIEMLNNDTIIGNFEVDYDSGLDEGYLKVIDGQGSGMVVTSDLGVSYFGSAELISLGGAVVSAGSSSSGVVGLIAKTDDNTKYIQITRSGGSTYNLETDLPLDMNNNKITSLATPTADDDAATKKYIDDWVGLLAGEISDLSSAVSYVVNNCCP